MIFTRKANATMAETDIKLSVRDMVKYMARSNHMAWVQWYFKAVYNREFMPAPHFPVMAKAIDDVMAGKIKRLVINMPPRHGKACCDSTPILTTKGWMLHGDLEEGDFVFGLDGKPRKVLQTRRFDPDMYDVTLANGEVIRVHANHEWSVNDRRSSSKTYVNVETHELAKQVWVGHKGERGSRRRWRLPDTEALDMPDAKLPVPPYTLGAWLGDGTRKTARICGVDPEVFEGIANDGYTVSTRHVHPVTGVTYNTYAGNKPGVERGQLSRDLVTAGLTGDKHIPEAYFTASIQQRLELMAGLIDTDGHVDQTNGRIRFSSCDKALVDDFVKLGSTLAFDVRVSEVEPKLSSSGIQGRRVTYVASFVPHIGIPTRIARKKIKKLVKRRSIGIDAIEKVHNPDYACQCISIGGDGIYLVGHRMVPTHNTEMTSIGLSARIMAINPSAKIMTLSYSDGLVRKNSRKIKQVFETPEAKMFFPEFKIHPVIKGDNHWETTKTGEVHAVTTQAEITGFEAGIAGDPFDGMLLIDDPQKASQANSPADRSRMKDVVADAITTRLNHVDTPIIIIQQRTHADDVTAFLLNGGTGDVWDTLVLPAWNETGKPPESYKQFTHCRLIDYDIPTGALWPWRKDKEALEAIRDAAETDDEEEPRGQRMFASQYQQDPQSSSIALNDKKWMRWYTNDDLKQAWSMNQITARIDTAQKGGLGSDAHAITFFGHDRKDDSVVRILDAHKFRGQFTDMATWAEEHIERMWHLQSNSVRFTTVTIEDANVGDALKNTLQISLKKKKVRVAIALTKRYGNKFERANEAAIFFQQGKFMMPNEMTRYQTEASPQGIWDMYQEFGTFNEADTHATDDQFDTMVWEAVTRYGKAPKVTAYAYANLRSQ